jgi:hypothetical protein
MTLNIVISRTPQGPGRIRLCLILLVSLVASCGPVEINVARTPTPSESVATQTTQRQRATHIVAREKATHTPYGSVPTPTSVLDAGHLSFGDPVLGVALEIPPWWQTHSTPGEITRFLQQDHTRSNRVVLTITAFDSATDTIELALDSLKRGTLGPYIRQVQPDTVGTFSALRLDLTLGPGRPPVVWILMAPSGRVVSIVPDVDPDWIEPVIEVVLDTMHAVQVTTEEFSTREPRPTAATIPTLHAPPSGDVSQLVEPLLIDGEKGWIFASALVNGQPKTVKLATNDGRQLAAYGAAGKLALDRSSGRLFVDQGSAGMTVLDATTGALLATVALPMPGQVQADPQVDPTTGRVFAFRGSDIYVLDRGQNAANRALTVAIPGSVCGDPSKDAPIAQSFYDLVNHKLYLVLTTYVCTPWVGYTIVGYDANTLEELGRYETAAPFQAVPFLDSLYGTTTSHVGRHVAWAWNGREAWNEEGLDGSARLQGIVADWKRQFIYEALNGKIRISKAYPRAMMGEIEVTSLAANGRLVGHDPLTDQLYFLVDGRLAIRPTATLFAPPTTEVEPTKPYCRPSEASTGLSASAHTLQVGERISATVILTNGSGSGVRLGRVQFSLSAEPPHSFSSENWGPVESSNTLEPGDSDAVHFALQAQMPGTATLAGLASYEMHAMDYSSGSWSGCQSWPLEIHVTP